MGKRELIKRNLEPIHETFLFMERRRISYSEKIGAVETSAIPTFYPGSYIFDSNLNVSVNTVLLVTV